MLHDTGLPAAYYIGSTFIIEQHTREAFVMSRRRRSMMSEELKTELAKELGFYETVEQEGWGGIRAVDAGNMVKRAIQLAEQAAARKL